MVNASLNWASIVGIVLAVCGGGLYFLRSFKPALARDYDVFFAAIGLLCGGILFFQGWRLDPILQFGQFLLAGTTVFFAYESVRLRGVATDQARRSSYFDDDQIPDIPRNSRSRYDDEYDKFEDSDRAFRRFKAQEEETEDDYIAGRSRGRGVARAIPESAVSRRRPSPRDTINQFENEEPRRRRPNSEKRIGDQSTRNNFGERRESSRNEVKRGSRPRPNQQRSRQKNSPSPAESSKLNDQSSRSVIRPQITREKIEDASFQSTSEVKKARQVRKPSTSRRASTTNQSGRYTVGKNQQKPRDNSSRFDD